MKNKITILLLVLGAMTIFFTCQKDEVQPEKQTVRKSLPDLKATILRGGNVIKANNKLETALQKFSQKTKTQIFERTINSETYDFSIDTTSIQQIETSDYISYTFFVERTAPSTAILENYVLTIFENDSISQMLIAYPVLNSNDRITYDIPNATVSSVQDNSLLYQR